MKDVSVPEYLKQSIVEMFPSTCPQSDPVSFEDSETPPFTDKF